MARLPKYAGYGGAFGRLRNNIRGELILDRADAVAQDELALLQALHLDEVGAGGGRQSGNRGIEVAMLLLQAHQLLPQLAFFLFGHRHRWLCFAPALRCRQKHRNYRVFHKTVQGSRKIAADQRLLYHLLRRKAGHVVALAAGLRYTYLVWEPLIEETFCMSMQSHLAELEKKHQALEQEINDCLTHPAVDDLRIVELKRKKLQVKDEIERLRQNGNASIH